MPLKDVYDYRVGTKCVDAIRRARKPFMFTCSFNMPHDPNVVPSPYYETIDKNAIRADVSLPCEERYRSELSRAIPALAGEEFLKEFLKIYYASVMLIDDQVGCILDALKKSGEYEHTVIIFTADHGDMAGGHGMFWKSTSAFYEEVVRVPLIVSVPGYEKSMKYYQPVELVDIMPTILELCGLQVPEGIDGRAC